MINFYSLDNLLSSYIEKGELSSSSILLRIGDEVFEKTYGYSDLEKKTPLKEDDIFRLMSMSKCIIAVSIMKLIEDGKISLDSNLSEYIPSFKNIHVVDDKRYVFTPNMSKLSVLWKILTFNKDNVKKREAKREITLRDLLSHSSGLGQGVYGTLRMLKDKEDKSTLSEMMDVYSKYLLDFDPGEGTGYSPLLGFDVLGRVIEVVTGKDLQSALEDLVYIPLEMHSTFFYPRNNDEKNRIVTLYKMSKGKLINVTNNKKENEDSLLHRGNDGYTAGCGGIYSNLTDFDHLAAMLKNNGVYNDKEFLKKESVDLLHTEAPIKHLEPEMGMVWGLGMRIRQDRDKGKFSPTNGTYGWSGAFGTHFFVSNEDDLSLTFMTNRTDLGGSGSYISRSLEDVIFNKILEKK